MADLSFESAGRRPAPLTVRGDGSRPSRGAWCAGLALALLLTAAFAGRADGQLPWYAHYVRALALIQSGDAEEARTELERALALRGEPGLRLPTDGVNRVDYLPHLYLAIAAHMSGDADAAREHFKRADGAGVAARSEGGRPLLESYRILLGLESGVATGVPPDPSDDRPGYAVFEPKATVLPQREFEELGRVVLGRCGLDPRTEFSQAPWYFHYELGLELARRGDPQRAVSALVDATDRRPDPRYGTRIYGMWFLDYQPYIQIAKLHAQLGNWRCASDALKVSEERGELSPGDPKVSELEALKKELESRLVF